MTLVDSHCHLDDKQFDRDRDEVVSRALEAGVESLLAIGSGDGPPDLEAAIRVAERFDSVWATVGVHPHDAAKCEDATFEVVRRLLVHPKVVAVGEIGLDYHYNFSPPEKQREVFARQLEIAREAGKPVIIHTREAWEDTFRLLGSGTEGIMHCFSGGPEEVRQCLDLGFYISFAGIVTYPKAIRVQEAARATPLERILVETDAPYLAPVPHRGKRNEPAFVRETVTKLAQIKGVSEEELGAATVANFRRVCLRPSRHNG